MRTVARYHGNPYQITKPASRKPKGAGLIWETNIDRENFIARQPDVPPRISACMCQDHLELELWAEGDGEGGPFWQGGVVQGGRHTSVGCC